MSNHNNEKIIKAVVQAALFTNNMRQSGLHLSANRMENHVLNLIAEEAADMIEHNVRNDIAQAERDENFQEGTR